MRIEGSTATVQNSEMKRSVRGDARNNRNQSEKGKEALGTSIQLQQEEDDITDKIAEKKKQTGKEINRVLKSANDEADRIERKQDIHEEKAERTREEIADIKRKGGSDLDVARLYEDMQADLSTARKINLEQLKYDPMQDASQTSDEMQKAASKEIIGMVLDDGKEKLEKEAEKAKETEDKNSEKKAEKEALEKEAEQAKAEEKETAEKEKEEKDILHGDTELDNMTQKATQLSDAQADVAEAKIAVLEAAHAVKQTEIKGNIVDTKI